MGNSTEGLESNNLKIPSQMDTKGLFRHEFATIQEVIDKLEKDMERYSRLKEYIKKELEDAA